MIKLTVMLFNSLSFLVFFPIVYLLYILTRRKLTAQNLLLTVASCIFYGWWDWRFLGLMLVTISIDFIAANLIQASDHPTKRKLFLTLSICANLTVLGFFKYFNFFSGGLEKLLGLFHLPVRCQTLNIILPIGISFYTFQAMSYVIDVYRKKIVPARRFLDYVCYVTYFPQLVAGPIERGAHLLPQILKPRRILRAEIIQGIYLVFWGFFKKLFIADNLAKIVDCVFNSPAPYPNGLEILLTVYAFAFQIYCDFSGYSDIARGLGKLMGFDIMINFRFPYFSKTPRDFWQRWHISLSTWFRDYVTMPLVVGKRHWGNWGILFAILVTFFICGLWHGAAWTFVLWGCYHGFLLVIESICDGFWPDWKNGFFASLLGKAVLMLATFHLVCLSWVIFRGNSLLQITQIMASLCSGFHLSLVAKSFIIQLVFYCLPLLAVEIYQARTGGEFALLKLKFSLRVAIFTCLAYLLLIFGEFGVKPFIYFQF